MIDSRFADVEGVKLHYLTAGQGEPVILLHGYAETSSMWEPIIPTLAERFTVLAPDLPGIGDSSIPADGLDMTTAAIRIHALARSLGFQKAEVVGHDIGLMVAYAYAATFPAEVEKLVVMDAFLPGVEGWESVYNNPGIWHFRFNGHTPEALVKDANASISSTSGTTSPRTKRVRFQRRTGISTPPLTLALDACERAGPTSFRSKRQPTILPLSRARNFPCPCLPSVAKEPMVTFWAVK